MRRHRTHTFHRKPQQKELLTWAALWRWEEVGVAAGGPSYLVFCKRQSRSHAWLFRKRGNAVQRQKQSRPGDTPPTPCTGSLVLGGQILWKESGSRRHGQEAGGQTGSRMQHLVPWARYCLPGFRAALRTRPASVYPPEEPALQGGSGGIAEVDSRAGSDPLASYSLTFLTL